MPRVLAETIDEFRPSGVVFDGTVESPAVSGLSDLNSQLIGFVGVTDATVKNAALAAYQRAVAEGWIGAGFQADATTGFNLSYLEKGDLSLTVSYRTAASFAQYPDDVDERRVDLEIELRGTGS